MYSRKKFVNFWPKLVEIHLLKYIVLYILNIYKMTEMDETTYIEL